LIEAPAGFPALIGDRYGLGILIAYVLKETPFIAPGLAVAAVFAFLISWSQYLTTLLIGGGRVMTLPLLLVSFQRGGDEAVTAALSLIFLAPTLIVFVTVARFLKNDT
jgi:putative spermidine/putrescine transport system permease protein